MSTFNLTGSIADRFGEAYVRMNSFEWDEMFEPKPEGFDQLSSLEKYHLPEFKNVFNWVRLSLTAEQRSMYWWTLGLKRTYAEWEKWWKENHAEWEEWQKENVKTGEVTPEKIVNDFPEE